MTKVILADRYNEHNIINEEKEIWVYDVLVALGADEKVLSSISKEKMSEYLTILEMEVWDNFDETIDIYRKGKLVGQWKKPKLKLIKEGKDKYYYEIHLNEWSLPFQMKRRGENV